MNTRIEATYEYRCFPALIVDLDRYHISAGRNGAGKTTLLNIPAPGEALVHLPQYHHETRHFKAEFGKLTAPMSVEHCQDPAFIKLRSQFRA